MEGCSLLSTAELDRLVAADPSTLADDESILELHRQLARLEAVVTRAAAAWDARQSWSADGARSGAAWLAHHTRLPKQACHRRLRLGRALRQLPSAEAAWLSGAIDGAHVSALTAQRNDTTAELLDRDEAMLVRQAHELPYRSWHRVLSYWRQLADPDGVEHDAARLHGDRRADIGITFGGAWHGDLLLDPVGGAIIGNTLRAIEHELFEHDWAVTRQRLGREPTLAELPRTAPQRRADAFVEMATRAMTVPRNGRRPRPLFTVLVGYETFAGRICELANGAPLAPGSVLPWLTEADVERAVFDGPARVIDVGHRRRLFGGATRRAAELQARECFHPLCDVPAEDCEIDHVEPYAVGGRTVAANGRPGCGPHNRGRSRRVDRPRPP